MQYHLGETVDFRRPTEFSLMDNDRHTYGIYKAIEILLDLHLEEEQIKQAIIKHFDMRYSEATVAFRKVKESLEKE